MAKCRSCGADIIFLTTDQGKYIPVDIDPAWRSSNYDLGPRYGARFEPEKGHVSHFATCKDAEKWRRQD